MCLGSLWLNPGLRNCVYMGQKQTNRAERWSQLTVATVRTWPGWPCVSPGWELHPPRADMAFLFPPCPASPPPAPHPSQLSLFLRKKWRRKLPLLDTDRKTACVLHTEDIVQDGATSVKILVL